MDEMKNDSVVEKTTSDSTVVEETPEQLEYVRKHKHRELQAKIRKENTPAFLKSSLFWFVALTILTLGGAAILFFADSSNIIRKNWGIQDAWLQPFIHFFGDLDVNLAVWIVFAGIFGLAFLILFATVLYKSRKKHHIQNYKIKHPGNEYPPNKLKIFRIVFFGIMTLFAGGGITLLVLLFQPFWGKIGEQFASIDPDALLRFLWSLGIVLAVMASVPLAIAIIVLIFKFLIFIVSFVAGSITSKVMSTAAYQENLAAAQTVAEQLINKARSEGSMPPINVVSSRRDSSDYDEKGNLIIFPALTAIDNKWDNLEKEKLKQEEAKSVEENTDQGPSTDNTTVETDKDTSSEAKENVAFDDLALKEVNKKDTDSKDKKAKTEKAVVTTKYGYFHDFVDQFQAYLANKLKLYYDKDVLRAFIAGLASSRLLLLQGLSGTGKSTLPRMFLRFVGGVPRFYPVQATWRDKTDVIGYYSDLTGIYKETELLKGLYEASYTKNSVNLMVLDEMNISRVEYYFADFLSIFEYPKSDWLIQLTQLNEEAKVPKLLEKGAVRIPSNTWFIGTINLDDSTFTVTDKVYDRAIIIDFDRFNVPFKSKYKDDERPTTMEEFEGFFQEAVDNERNRLTEAEAKKFLNLLGFIDETFNVRIGNRVMNQLNTFVPVFVALGGSKLDALDFIFSTKTIRKLDTKFESYMPEALIKLERYLVKEYGKNSFKLTNIRITNLKKKFA